MARVLEKKHQLQLISIPLPNKLANGVEWANELNLNSELTCEEFFAVGIANCRQLYLSGGYWVLPNWRWPTPFSPLVMKILCVDVWWMELIMVFVGHPCKFWLDEQKWIMMWGRKRFSIVTLLMVLHSIIFICAYSRYLNDFVHMINIQLMGVVSVVIIVTVRLAQRRSTEQNE